MKSHFDRHALVFILLQCILSILWAQNRFVFAQEKIIPLHLNQQVKLNALQEKSEGIVTEGDISKEELKIFGNSLFRGQPLTEISEIPGSLPLLYRLGAGDHLGIYLGGKAEQHFEVIVSVDGKIYIPTVGIFAVSSLTIDEFRSVIDKRLGAFYSNYNIEVMLIRPKSIQLSVIGEVEAPGNYVISALNTVLEAVVRAQGPTSRGSIRDVQVFRHDSLAAHIDLYEFLLDPKREPDFFLQNGDKIFVPIIRSHVRVTGEVNREAIYELNPNKEENLCDIISLAGGFTDMAFKDKVELSSVKPGGDRVIRYVNLSEKNVFADTSRDCVLANNDRIHVYSKLDQIPKQIVTILGEVNKPGEYEFEENMHVSDLIIKAGSLTRSAFHLSAEVAKVDPKKSVKTVKINLDSLLSDTNPSKDIILEPDDHVFIRKIPEWQVGPLVEFRGEVQFPGFYPIVRDSTFLSDVFEKAGGFTKQALVSEAKLVRFREPMLEDKEYQRLTNMRRDEMSDLEYEYFVMKQNTEDVREIVLDFYELLVKNKKSEDVLLKEGDVIVIPKKPDVVFVSGRVSRPGGVLYKPGKKFDYYIKKAGGFSWDANGGKAKIIKVTGEIVDDEDVKTFTPGDRIWVPRKQERNFWRIFRDTMLVAGQMATIYLVIKNATE